MSAPRDLAAQLVAEPFAFPGGYPCFALTDDGGAICHRCCAKEAETIAESSRGDGWHVVALDINWESSLVCDHCGQEIPSAYGLPEGEE